jgi:hypothetical protein
MMECNMIFLLAL